jgi:hypothetical protein
MANTTLQLKKSGQTGNVPNSLAYGELALNYADGKLFYKASNGSIASISTAPATDSFATINANSSLILASSPYDTLSIIPGNNITISTDAFNKTITINSTAIGGGGDGTDQFARDKANSANVLAQAAFDKANTGITGTYTITGAQYVDYGWVPQTAGPILFDYGTL